MQDPEDDDLYLVGEMPTAASAIQGIEQIERYVREEDVDTARCLYELAAHFFMRGADEAGQARLRAAAETLGIDPDTAQPVATQHP